MTTYRTGNAIGSADPRDLYDNAGNLDVLVNSQDKAEHPDRLGVPRKTWHGMEQGFEADQMARGADFQAFLVSSGYELIDEEYGPGIEVTARNQIIRAGGELWRLSASEDLPYTTTGAGMPEDGAFVSVGDAALRQELADPAQGGELVHVTTSTGEQTLAEALDDRVNGGEVGDQAITTRTGTSTVGDYLNRSEDTYLKFNDRVPIVADGKFLQLTNRTSTTAYTSSSTNYSVSSDLITFEPRDSGSYLLVNVTLDMEVTGENDNSVSADTYLTYYDGDEFINIEGPYRVGITAFGLSPTTFATRAPVSFSIILPPSLKRFDGVYSTPNGAWSLRTRTAAISDATWATSRARFTLVELGTDGRTPLDSLVGTVSHVFLYGQSLSIGATSNPAITTDPVRPGRAVMFSAGVRTLGTQMSSSDVDTVLGIEKVYYLRDLLEENTGSSGETHGSQLAYELTRSNGLPEDEAVLVSAHGIGGRPYDQLKQGTQPYFNLLSALRRARVISSLNGRLHRTLGVSFVHGEANREDAAGVYQASLEELQSNLTTDVRRIDGRFGEVCLFTDQISNWTNYGLSESNVPFDQLQAAVDNPGKIYCVGPKYMLPTTDGVHLTAEGYAHLGAYHGQVMRRVEVVGTDWLPLHATSATRSGDTVILKFHMPVAAWGPLTLDTSTVTDPGDYGFRWIDDGNGNSVSISSVFVSGDDEVTITLSETPTATGQQIGIADIGTAGVAGGPTTGPRCNLRDQSTFTSSYGQPLHNWACHQRINVG